MPRLIAKAAILPALLMLATPAASQTLTLGEVMVFHAPALKPDADLPAFEKYVTGELAPAWSKQAPGMTLKLVKKDRGPRQGQYLLVWVTDTTSRHGAYAAPVNAPFPFSDALIGKVGDFRSRLAAFTTGPGTYSEYRLIAPDKVGAPLPTVDVLGNHHIKVRPERVAEFDTFIGAKLHPAVGNLRPDLRFLYYKPIRGDAPGNYITVIALTKASRDKYWPKGADSDVLKATFTPALKDLAKELESYLVAGTWGVNMTAAVYEAKEWVDWTVLN
jgi:hypothetical protein